MPDSEWMSVTGAARVLGRSDRTIRRWIAEGRLDIDRAGSRLLVRVTAGMAGQGQVMPSDKVTIAVLTAG